MNWVRARVTGVPWWPGVLELRAAGMEKSEKGAEGLTR